MPDHPAYPFNEILQKKSLRDEVFDLLYARVIAGQYTRGEWLRQEDIASQLDVSQTPVREALDLLVSAGLAERVPYRGVRIRELSHTEILDAYILRLQLESLTVRLAALNISASQSEQLQALVEETRSLVTLQDMPRLRQLNKRFHSLIAEYSGNPLLARMYEMASNIFPDWMLYEFLYRHPELLQPSLENEFQEHLAIFRAIAAHDAETAARCVVEHIRNLGSDLVRSLGLPAQLVSYREEQILPLIIRSNEK
jgi:DNA-binding GntR family transcriptional regulator